jgi:hypothetical protein
MKTCKACGKEWHPSVLECSCGKSLRRIGRWEVLFGFILIVGLMLYWSSRDDRPMSFGSAGNVASPTTLTEAEPLSLTEYGDTHTACRLLGNANSQKDFSEVLGHSPCLPHNCVSLLDTKRVLACVKKWDE